MDSAEDQPARTPHANSGSGASVAGDVHTQEFVGRDHIVHGDEVGGDKVGGDKVTTGDIDQSVVVIGRDASVRIGEIREVRQLVQYITHHPPEWQGAIWSFLSNNRRFLAVAALLEVALAMLYLQYGNLFLIPISYWAVAALLLLVAAWEWYSWRRFDSTFRKVGTASLATLLVAGVLGWQGWRIAFPDHFNPLTFGIAVAELGEGADFRRTASAREISGQVYESLCREIARAFDGQEIAGQCGASGQPSEAAAVAVKRVGVIRDTGTADWIGRRIGADVVVWGQLLTTSERGATIRFQILDTQDRAESPELPLVLPVTTQAADIFVNASELDLASDPILLKEAVGRQATAISAFTLGLVNFLDLDHPQAIRQLETAERAL
ncbi:MAG: hypothetical protein ACRDIB_20105, partial [Ardenticatenaceae bacterium]